MEKEELLTVDHTFFIGQAIPPMLVLSPKFRQPDNWADVGWARRTEEVTVVRPDGVRLPATAQINLTHLNIRDPDAPIEDRWPITVWLTDRTDEEVPIGSRILVKPEHRDRHRCGSVNFNVRCRMKNQYKISLVDRILMRLRGSDVKLIAAALRKCKDHSLDLDAPTLEAHHLAGADLDDFVAGIVLARENKIQGQLEHFAVVQLAARELGRGSLVDEVRRMMKLGRKDLQSHADTEIFTEQ